MGGAAVVGRDIHTNHGLWIVGSRSTQTELSKVFFGLLRESIESCFGTLLIVRCAGWPARGRSIWELTMMAADSGFLLVKD